MPKELVPWTVVARRKVGLSDCHAHRVADALPERAGRGVNAGSDATLRVSGRLAPPLTEPLDLIEGQVVARQVKQRVEESGSMSGRKDESITVPP